MSQNNDGGQGERLADRPELQEKLSELEILRQSLLETKAKEREMFEQLLRLNAEYQNFRKRSETRVSDARRAGREDVLLQIISIADALQHAELSSRQASDVETLKRGLTLVREQVEKFLKDQGLVAISAKGEKLDPARHEAIARIENAEVEEGTVVEEIQRGYTLDGQLVRPARVAVSTRSDDMANAKANEEEHHG